MQSYTGVVYNKAIELTGRENVLKCLPVLVEFLGRKKG